MTGAIVAGNLAYAYADQEALIKVLEVFIRSVKETEQRFLPSCENNDWGQFMDTNATGNKNDTA